MSHPNMYGYIRVSSIAQNEDRQVFALLEFGVPTSNLYIDKQSGKDFERPAYQELVGKLRSDSTLVVKSIDRLGRNYEEILMQWRVITKEKRAAIVVLDMPLLDTRERERRDLTGTFIADIVLQILSYVSETERSLIRARQREGIEAAKRRGVKFGRPRFVPDESWYAMLEMWRGKNISARKAALALKIDRKTFCKWAARVMEA